MHVCGDNGAAPAQAPTHPRLCVCAHTHARGGGVRCGGADANAGGEGRDAIGGAGTVGGGSVGYCERRAHS